MIRDSVNLWLFGGIQVFRLIGYEVLIDTGPLLRVEITVRRGKYLLSKVQTFYALCQLLLYAKAM